MAFFPERYKDGFNVAKKIFVPGGISTFYVAFEVMATPSLSGPSYYVDKEFLTLWIITPLTTFKHNHPKVFIFCSGVHLYILHHNTLISWIQGLSALWKLLWMKIT